MSKDKPELEDFYDSTDPRGCSTSEYNRYIKAIKEREDEKSS